jgi:ABC-type transport system involved in cytochrome bd biosynthesis fused ATPase/permease subunit
MLRSVFGQTILLLVRSSIVGAYSSWPRKLGLVPSVVLAILLLPLIASLKGQAALAQISSGQIHPAQAYPAQTYPAQTYPAQTYRTQTHRTSRRAVPAQQKAWAQQLAPQNKYNDWRLMILGGYPGTTYFNLVHDIAAALGGATIFA